MGDSKDELFADFMPHFKSFMQNFNGKAKSK